MTRRRKSPAGLRPTASVMVELTSCFHSGTTTELPTNWFADVFTDEEAEPAGPSELHQADSSPNHSDSRANGTQNWMQPVCNDCGDSPNLNPDGQSAAELQQRVGGPATEEEEGTEEGTEEEEPEVVVQEAEDDKQEEARSPSPLANEQPAKRRACRKRRRSLFTIQAVNSNGVTERPMGEGCNAVSFGCECARTCMHWFPETVDDQISSRK